MKRVKVTTEPIFNEVKDVNRIIFHIFFPIKYNRKNVANRALVNRMLTTCSNKYRTPEEFGKAYDDKFIMSYRMATSVARNYELVDFQLVVPREGLIDAYSLDEALEFFHDVIFDPCVSNNQFDVDHFNWEKDFIKKNNEGYPRNIEEYSNDTFDNFTDKKERYGLSHKSYMKLLDKVSPKSAYKYYKKNILNNNYFTFISGAIDDQEHILEVYNKYFKQDFKNIDLDVNYFDINKIYKYHLKEVESTYQQSMLMKRYAIKNYKEDEYVKLNLLYFFLEAKENNLIYHKLRVENNLIYHNSIYKYNIHGFFDIFVYLDYQDISLCNKLIDDVFAYIKVKDNFNMCKERTIKAMTYDILSDEDNPFNEVSEIINRTVNYNMSLKDELEIFKNITYEEMMEFIDRLVVTHELIIKGGVSHE